MSRLLGLHIKLDRPIDRERPCCRNICTIGPGKHPRIGILRCAYCGPRPIACILTLFSSGWHCCIYGCVERA
jgi:hypothetical protein